MNELLNEYADMTYNGITRKVKNLSFFFRILTFRIHERSEWGFAPHPDFFLKTKTVR